MQRERGRRSRRMIVSFNRKDRQQRRLSRAESWRHVQAGGSLSFLGAEVITRIALPGENFFLAESRAYTTPTLYFSPPHPLATLLSSRTAHARRELFACMDRARHVNREHRRHFSFFLSLSPFFPRNVEFHGSRHTALFHFLAAYSRGENKTAGIFQTYWPGDECTPRPEVFLYFAQFHSSRIYGVTRERYTHVSEKMVEDSRAFHLLKGRFKNYYFYRFYEK